MVDWVQKNGWTIQNGIAPVFRENHISRFKLVKGDSIGGRDTYRVEFTPATPNDLGDMDPAWTDCVLIERGSSELEWTVGALPRFDIDNSRIRERYRDGINAVMPSANADTLRLVGELPVGNKKETVILVITENAVETNAGKEPMLVIITSTRFPVREDLMMLQDGTGHARPT